MAHPNIEALSIRWALSPSNLVSISNLKSIKHIKLDCCPIIDDERQLLPVGAGLEVLSKMRQLESIWIRDVSIRSSDIEPLYRISNLHSLRVEADGVDHNMLGALSGIKKLSSLHLNGLAGNRHHAFHATARTNVAFSGQPEQDIELGSKFARWSSIKEVRLEDVSLPNGYIQLFSRLPNLTQMEFSNFCMMDIKSLSYFRDSRLEMLKISEPMTSGWESSDLEALFALKTLRSLDLSYCVFRANSINALSQLRELESMTVRNNFVDLNLIGQALSKLPRLRQLKIGFDEDDRLRTISILNRSEVKNESDYSIARVTDDVLQNVSKSRSLESFTVLEGHSCTYEGIGHLKKCASLRKLIIYPRRDEDGKRVLPSAFLDAMLELGHLEQIYIRGVMPPLGFAARAKSMCPNTKIIFEEIHAN